MTAREPRWEQNGLFPMVNIMLVASAKSRSAREASHQSAFMGSCLNISQMWQPVYLVVDELRPCVLWSLMIRLMVVLLTFF